MNKEYIYVKDDVVIKDENNKLSYVENTENIEEILKQENVIEQINNTIQKKKKMHKDNSGCIIISGIGSFLMLVFLGIVLVLIMIYFKKLDSVSILLLAGISMASITSEVILFINYYISKKQNKALEYEIPFLEKSLELEKEKLQELSLHKQIERKGVSITIDEKEKLDSIERKLQLYLFLKENLKQNPPKTGVLPFSDEECNGYGTEEEIYEVKDMLESEMKNPKVFTR